MYVQEISSAPGSCQVRRIFDLPKGVQGTEQIKSKQFRRVAWDVGQAVVLLDTFSTREGPSCCFLRLAPGETRTVQLVAEGVNRLKLCPSGGWILEPCDTALPLYWIPQSPVLRTFDANSRILSEKSAPIVDFRISDGEFFLEIEVADDMHLDWVLWRFPTHGKNIQADLENPLVLEKQPIYFWSSQTTYRALADVYRYLIHGHIYQNRLAWPRKWKICSELDAYELYITLSGLELATRKELYGLLKRQIVFSAISRQSQDGGWYHGEWTDLMESHYRFHTGGIHLLLTALEEQADDVVRESLQRAAAFIASRTDKTELGLWFLHDSLEDSAEMMDEMVRQTPGFGKWMPSRILGKSPTNKMVLNTHLDTIVALDRYREVTGDSQYEQLVTSARSAARRALNLRPAEYLYRLLFWAVELTLRPASEAKKLPLAIRAIKRLTWMYLTPRFYLIKKIFPRFIMPGGYIDRQVPLHFGTKYHPVNIVDLARLWRRFSEEDYAFVMKEAVNFVVSKSILEFWAEAKPRRFSIVVWTDALYHLCLLDEKPEYRRYLAAAILYISDLDLGLPPSLLGANKEVTGTKNQIPCPLLSEPRLRVVNLSRDGHIEILVINPTTSYRKLNDKTNLDHELNWTTSDGRSLLSGESSLQVPPRGWLWGQSIHSK